MNSNPQIDVNIRNRYSEMQINGSVVSLNQSNRVSLNLEGSQELVANALRDLLANVPEQWKKLQAATGMVIDAPLTDEFGEDGAEPMFVLSISIRQKLTRHDEVSDDEDVDIEDDLEEEEA